VTSAFSRKGRKELGSCCLMAISSSLASGVPMTVGETELWECSSEAIAEVATMSDADEASEVSMCSENH